MLAPMSTNKSSGRKKCSTSAMSANSCRPTYTLPVAPVMPGSTTSEVPLANGVTIGYGNVRETNCHRIHREKLCAGCGFLTGASG